MKWNCSLRGLPNLKALKKSKGERKNISSKKKKKNYKSHAWKRPKSRKILVLPLPKKVFKIRLILHRFYPPPSPEFSTLEVEHFGNHYRNHFIRLITLFIIFRKKFLFLKRMTDEEREEEDDRELKKKKK